MFEADIFFQKQKMTDFDENTACFSTYEKNIKKECENVKKQKLSSLQKKKEQCFSEKLGCIHIILYLVIIDEKFLYRILIFVEHFN